MGKFETILVFDEEMDKSVSIDRVTQRKSSRQYD